MFTQLNPCLPVHVEGKGKGIAFAVIDYSQEHDLIWVVITDDGGEIWCVPNKTIRAQENWTAGRTKKNQTDQKP